MGMAEFHRRAMPEATIASRGLPGNKADLAAGSGLIGLDRQAPEQTTPM
jgi:hypothetical protein